MGDIAWAARLLEEAALAQNKLTQTLDAVARSLGFEFFCVLHPGEIRSPPTTDDGAAARTARFDDGEWILTDSSGSRLGAIRNGKTLLDTPATGHDNLTYAGWRFVHDDFAWNFAFVGSVRNDAHAPDREKVQSVIALVNRTLQVILGTRQAHVRGVFDGLAATRTAAVLINANGRVGLLTPRAQRLFGLDFGIKDGRLWSAHGGSDAELRRLTDLAANSTGSRATSPFVIERFSDSRPVLARPLALPGLASDLFVGARLILFLTTPGHSDMIEEGALQTLFGLSNAEAQIAALLAEGLEPQQIAARRNVSVGTIRVQMKHIFQKVKVHRQAELIKVIAELRPPMEMAV